MVALGEGADNPIVADLRQSLSGLHLTAIPPVAGFAIVEASDMAEAIELVSRSPCAVARGVVEVWPLREV